MLKLKYIDALRGLAVLAVLIVHTYHFGDNTHLPALFAAFVNKGIYGVQLFFFISAFTLFLSVNARYDKEKHFKGNFFIRRFFRIAPMFYLEVIYYLWQNGTDNGFWLGDDGKVTTANIVSNFFFVQGFKPSWINSIVPGGWSVAVEMVFYLFIPFLFYRIKNTQQAAVFFFICLAIRLVLDVVFHKIHPIHNDALWYLYLYYYFPSQLSVFALGILFYFVIKDNYKLTLNPCLILITAIVLLVHFAAVPVIPEHVAFTIAFFVLAIALIKCEYKIIVNRFTAYMGKISYSVYLTHFAVFYWLNKFNLVNYLAGQGSTVAVFNFVIRFLLVMILSALLSTILHYLIELPGQRLGYRIIKKRENN
jgi:peptidoglycan/LPS O-acetylase OafA/YrhL